VHLVVHLLLVFDGRVRFFVCVKRLGLVVEGFLHD